MVGRVTYQETVAMTSAIFLCHNWGLVVGRSSGGAGDVESGEVRLLLGAEARNAAKPLTMHGAAPQQRIISLKVIREL